MGKILTIEGEPAPFKFYAYVDYEIKGTDGNLYYLKSFKYLHDLLYDESNYYYFCYEDVKEDYELVCCFPYYELPRKLKLDELKTFIKLYMEYFSNYEKYDTYFYESHNPDNYNKTNIMKEWFDKLYYDGIINDGNKTYEIEWS